MCRHPLEYLQDWVNWLEIPLYLCSMIFTFVFATPCLCVYNWQWQIGVIAEFLGWIGLISFLQKWPVTGIYVLMFINIIQSFLKIAFLALLLVIAFALAFYMLFFEPDEIVSIVCIPDQSESIDLSWIEAATVVVVLFLSICCSCNLSAYQISYDHWYSLTAKYVKPYIVNSPSLLQHLNST